MKQLKSLITEKLVLSKNLKQHNDNLEVWNIFDFRNYIKNTYHYNEKDVERIITYFSTDIDINKMSDAEYKLLNDKVKLNADRQYVYDMGQKLLNDAYYVKLKMNTSDKLAQLYIDIVKSLRIYLYQFHNNDKLFYLIFCNKMENKFDIIELSYKN